MDYEIVVIGTSLGGLAALETILAGLPAEFPLPIAVVQHRSAESDGTLAMILRRHTRLRVREPHDKERVVPGMVYLAPADYHLLVENGSFALSTGGVVSYARPSIDVLFDSAADSYGEKTIGVILTGANHDGAAGAARIKAHGGYLIVQEPVTAESSVMPKATLAATTVDCILPLLEIAAHLTTLCLDAQKEPHDY